jgi:hypothetical protein
MQLIINSDLILRRIIPHSQAQFAFPLCIEKQEILGDTH